MSRWLGFLLLTLCTNGNICGHYGKNELTETFKLSLLSVCDPIFVSDGNWKRYTIINGFFYFIVFKTDGKMGKMLPLIVYAVLTITVGLLSIRLPETNKRKLIATVHEAEGRWVSRFFLTKKKPIVQENRIELAQQTCIHCIWWKQC
jgi:hypothetical protein